MLADRLCAPLPEGTPALTLAERNALVTELGSPWEMVENNRLRRTFRFGSFRDALAFVVDVGRMADEQDHHPEIVLAWGRATIEIWTHSVGGLSENDFIFAARADRIAADHPVT
jgi:4a-hydroxytetrahydrobiopterin dehydratase